MQIFYVIKLFTNNSSCVTNNSCQLCTPATTLDSSVVDPDPYSSLWIRIHIPNKEPHSLKQNKLEDKGVRLKIKFPHSATQLTKNLFGATIFLKFVKKILYLKKIHFFLHYFYIFLKIDNITLGSGSRLGQNSGSGSKFYVFGSIHNTEQLSSHSTTQLTETMVKLSISIM